MDHSEPNLFKRIFIDFWEEFKLIKLSYSTDYYDSVVNKMLSCGDPSKGYVEFMCLHCGLDQLRVGITCKNFLCLHCGRLRAMDFVEEVMAKIHEGVLYRHLILTISDKLRNFFYNNRKTKEAYNAFIRCGRECFKELMSEVADIEANIGGIEVLHLTGRKSAYNPHLHFIIMNGAIDEATGKWVNLPYFPYEKLRHKWRDFVLDMVNEFDKSEKNQKLVEELRLEHKKEGFVFKIKTKNVPKKPVKLAKYLSKYLFRPSISTKRILEYDYEKKEVVYEYNCHETQKLEKEKVDVFTFIGRMVQQILPKGFQRARYFGLQATCSYRKSKEKILKGIKNIINAPRDKDENLLIKRASKLTFREKILKWTGKDPLKCKKCGNTMELVKICIDGLVVYDYLEELPSFEIGALE